MHKRSVILIATLLGSNAFADEPAPGPVPSGPSDPATPATSTPSDASAGSEAAAATVAPAPTPASAPAAPSDSTKSSTDAASSSTSSLEPPVYVWPGFLGGVTFTRSGGTYDTMTATSYDDSAIGFGMHASATWDFHVGRFGIGAHVEAEVGANVTSFGYLGHIRFGPELGYVIDRNLEVRLRYELFTFANSARDVGAGDDIYVTTLGAQYKRFWADVGMRTDLVAFPGLATFNSLLDYWTVGGMYRVNKNTRELGMYVRADVDHFGATMERDYSGTGIRLSLLFSGS